MKDYIEDAIRYETDEKQIKIIEAFKSEVAEGTIPTLITIDIT